MNKDAQRKIIDSINIALGFNLTQYQIDYIFNDKDYPDLCPCALGLKDPSNVRDFIVNGKCGLIGRRTGRTTAHILRLILFSDEPINLDKLIDYCDHPKAPHYAKYYFRDLLLDIHGKLKHAGIPVVELVSR